MKELSIEDMTSLRGGSHKSNRANVIAKNNTAVAVDVAFQGKKSGDLYQYATANAGNQDVTIDQSN